MKTHTSDADRRCTPALLHAGASIAASKLAVLEDSWMAEIELNDSNALDLYEGPWGHALFWGAMAVCAPKDQDRWRRRCLRWLNPLRERVERWRDEPGTSLPEAPIGAFNGLGAPIYALSILSCLFEDDELVEAAESVAALLTAQRISRDTSFDIVEGSAGTILALLALDSVLSQRGCSATDRRRLSPQQAASQCAEHLLSQMRRERPGAGAWPASYSGNLQSGFGHGAAGIRFALMRLAALQPEPRFLEAAVQSNAFEESLYLPAKQRWLPYPGFSPEGPLMTAWCWGGPGIALSHLWGAAEESASGWRPAALRKALGISLEMKSTLEDFLCCGNLGRAMILDYGHRLGVAGESGRSLHLAADQIAFDVLRRLKQRGDFGWSVGHDGDSAPASLMKGVAGVGYAFLYLAAPRRLPMILCCEPPPAAE